MERCIFCEIVSKKIPAKIVYEDEKVIAINDINPQAPIHILIIPKKHIPTILDLEVKDNDLMGHIIQVAKKIAKEKNISERGFRMVMNCNSEGGQTVYHIHLHILGGRIMGWPPG